MTMTVSFDPNSLKQIAALAGLNILLTPEVQAAMSQGGDLLVQAAQANTDARFKNPTGFLRDSIHKVVDSPFELQVGSDVIYSRRREYGFSGMTDSLNRYYAHDPGAFYFTDAMSQQSQAVLQLLDAAVSTVLGGL